MKPTIVISLFISMLFACAQKEGKSNDLAANRSVSSDSALRVNIDLDSVYIMKMDQKLFEMHTRETYQLTTEGPVEIKHFAITVKLINNTDDTLYLYMMTCSWEHYFMVNNNYIFFKHRNCDNNLNVLHTLLPGETKTEHAQLMKSPKFDYSPDFVVHGKQVETTKIGLIILNDLFDPEKDCSIETPRLRMGDRSLWKILWSNSLYLLDK